MIKLIGFKRLVFLVCMVVLTLSILIAYFFSVGPMLDDAVAQRDAINGQITELQGKISAIKKDMAFAKENLPKYNDLSDKGFFYQQDRFLINRRMEDLRRKEGIDSFSFSVADVAEIPNADAAAINYKLINSQIKIDRIVSPLDANIYMLVQDMAEVFPDYARVQSMDITRKLDVTEEALKNIKEQKPVNFVDANIEFDWITMVPKSVENAPAPDGAPAGFRGQ